MLYIIQLPFSLVHDVCGTRSSFVYSRLSNVECIYKIRQNNIIISRLITLGKGNLLQLLEVVQCALSTDHLSTSVMAIAIIYIVISSLLENLSVLVAIATCNAYLVVQHYMCSYMIENIIKEINNKGNSHQGGPGRI